MITNFRYSRGRSGRGSGMRHAARPFTVAGVEAQRDPCGGGRVPGGVATFQERSESSGPLPPFSALLAPGRGQGGEAGELARRRRRSARWRSARQWRASSRSGHAKRGRGSPARAPSRSSAKAPAPLSPSCGLPWHRWPRATWPAASSPRLRACHHRLLLLPLGELRARAPPLLPFATGFATLKGGASLLYEQWRPGARPPPICSHPRPRPLRLLICRSWLKALMPSASRPWLKAGSFFSSSVSA